MSRRGTGEKARLRGVESMRLSPDARFSAAREQRTPTMRTLTSNEIAHVAGGANPHLTVVTTNPGGVVNKSALKNPNTQTFTFKTTGKPA